MFGLEAAPNRLPKNFDRPLVSSIEMFHGASQTDSNGLRGVSRVGHGSTTTAGGRL